MAHQGKPVDAVRADVAVSRRAVDALHVRQYVRLHVSLWESAWWWPPPLLLLLPHHPLQHHLPHRHGAMLIMPPVAAAAASAGSVSVELLARAGVLEQLKGIADLREAALRLGGVKLRIAVRVGFECLDSVRLQCNIAPHYWASTTQPHTTYHRSPLLGQYNTATHNVTSLPITRPVPS